MIAPVSKNDLPKDTPETIEHWGRPRYDNPWARPILLKKHLKGESCNICNPPENKDKDRLNS
jgi:hypothetical protein